MRAFGWTVAIVVGGYASYVFIKSIPDVVRYLRLSRM
jgi:hypothetical protein